MGIESLQIVSRLFYFVTALKDSYMRFPFLPFEKQQHGFCGIELLTFHTILNDPSILIKSIRRRAKRLIARFTDACGPVGGIDYDKQGATFSNPHANEKGETFSKPHAAQSVKSIMNVTCHAAGICGLHLKAVSHLWSTFSRQVGGFTNDYTTPFPLVLYL